MKVNQIYIIIIIILIIVIVVVLCLLYNYYNLKLEKFANERTTQTIQIKNYNNTSGQILPIYMHYTFLEGDVLKVFNGSNLL